jgi:hypothetical protein
VRAGVKKSDEQRREIETRGVFPLKIHTPKRRRRRHSGGKRSLSKGKAQFALFAFILKVRARANAPSRFYCLRRIKCVHFSQPRSLFQKLADKLFTWAGIKALCINNYNQPSSRGAEQCWQVNETLIYQRVQASRSFVLEKMY